MLQTLRQRNFALVWFGGLISMIGDWVLIAALPYHIYALTGSALRASGLLIAYTVPSLIFGSVAGVFVDRWDRKRTMVIANLTRAPLMLLLIAVRTPDMIWIVYVVAFVESSIGQLFGPAENALLPTLVGDDQLVAANSLNALNNNLARLIGPSFGAVLLAMLGLPAVVLVDSASYLVSAMLVALIVTQVRTSVPARDQTQAVGSAWRSVWREWCEGLVLVGTSRLIIALFAVLAITTVADSFNSSLLVPFVQVVLHGSPQIFAWLLTAQAISGLVASVLIGRIGQVVSPRQLVTLSAAAASCLFAIAYNVPVLPLVLFLAALLGFPAVGFGVGSQTLLQTATTDQYRGRVFGALGTINGLMAVLALGAGGALADQFGVRPMLNVVVGLWCLVAVIGLILLRPGQPAPDKQTH